MKEQIIDYIRCNRVSTTEAADCLGKTGVLPMVRSVNRGHFCVGEIYWVYATHESNWHVHEMVQNIPKGCVVLIEPFHCNDRAIIGDLVSKYILLYKQATALVVMGNLRDTPRLIKENWPIWCSGFNPVGCFNAKVDDLAPEIRSAHHDAYHGAIAVCDDTGVVVIPKAMHTLDFYKKMEFIEEQEDIWYDCIDRKKWSTFDTICLKKYKDKQA